MTAHLKIKLDEDGIYWLIIDGDTKKAMINLGEKGAHGPIVDDALLQALDFQTRADHRYEQLKSAVQDMLLELRIDSTCLIVMAKGYSPDYPGAVEWPDDGDPQGQNPYCKVQLSQVVADKLLSAGVKDWKFDRKK